jgi:hypothetical protein
VQYYSQRTLHEVVIRDEVHTRSMHVDLITPNECCTPSSFRGRDCVRSWRFSRAGNGKAFSEDPRGGHGTKGDKSMG